jgi:hypothetical protein
MNRLIDIRWLGVSKSLILNHIGEPIREPIAKRNGGKSGKE